MVGCGEVGQEGGRCRQTAKETVPLSRWLCLLGGRRLLFCSSGELFGGTKASDQQVEEEEVECVKLESICNADALAQTKHTHIQYMSPLTRRGVKSPLLCEDLNVSERNCNLKPWISSSPSKGSTHAAHTQLSLAFSLDVALCMDRRQHSKLFPTTFTSLAPPHCKPILTLVRDFGLNLKKNTRNHGNGPIGMTCS